MLLAKGQEATLRIPKPPEGALPEELAKCRQLQGSLVTVRAVLPKDSIISFSGRTYQMPILSYAVRLWWTPSWLVVNEDILVEGSMLQPIGNPDPEKEA